MMKYLMICIKQYTVRYNLTQGLKMKIQAQIPPVSKRTPLLFQTKIYPSTVQVLNFEMLPVFMISSYVYVIPTDTPTLEPLTVELLFRRLLPHSSKWQSLGEALSLDEDRLDEIFTNNEGEEGCLQEMLEHYTMRSDLNHSWEEIEAALKRIEMSSEYTA